MTQDGIDTLVERFGEELTRMDGYDDCIVGVVERFGQPPILCYDKQGVISKLRAGGDMTTEEAEEFWSLNQIGAWVGDSTPCFLTTVG